MEKWLLSPPAAFVVILGVSWLILLSFSRLSFKPKKHTSGERESYACGEENYDQTAQPDYSNFFPFAFFFTLAHVATLIMTTVMAQGIQAFIIAALYIIGSVLGLYILFRK
jgi:NADH:ubiquinone oxidoreductase subunit 3 (subunit A)